MVSFANLLCTQRDSTWFYAGLIIFISMFYSVEWKCGHTLQHKTGRISLLYMDTEKIRLFNTEEM